MDDETLIGRCAARRKQLLEQARRRGDPSGAVEEIQTLVRGMFEQIRSLDPEERRTLIAQLTKSDSEFLFNIAFNAAIFSVREQSRNRLRDGLMALLLENGREDTRMTVMRLCLLCHSAKMLGVCIQELFDEVRQYGAAQTVRLFDSYFAEGEKDISAMGYQVCDENGNFMYRQVRW